MAAPTTDLPNGLEATEVRKPVAEQSAGPQSTPPAEDVKPAADDDKPKPEAAQNNGDETSRDAEPPRTESNATGGTPLEKKKSSKEPAGGYDATKIPHMPPGFTIKITFHRAENLPMADFGTFSSDPYIVTQMYTTNPTRHKEDPPLRNRTPTVRRDVNPEWNSEWIVANVPASGFKLKCRLYDEDPADHDDRLGNAHIEVPSLSEDWPGIRSQQFKLKKRMGSKRAYLAQGLATTVRMRKHFAGHLIVSIELLGRTESEHGARVYTAGPMWYTKHYSPLLGRMMGQKTPGKEDEGEGDAKESKNQMYNFQANQMQLEGPVPAELYHRYVEFKPFVKRMFTNSGIRGFFLHRLLYHQHQQIYHFDRQTEFEYLKAGPSKESTLKFLDLVHYDTGGRIFTYIISLDSLFRFTETGKEFGIDMLSKHTMHSEVAAYIAYSGEFFIRRLKHPNRAPPEEGGDNETHPPHEIDGGPPDNDPPKDPAHYELIIDNDSGTYRPNADLLPKLKEFLQHNLPGLKVVTLDCQKDEELQQKLKEEQRKKKEEEGDHIIYRQLSRNSSISSSDESDLENMISRNRVNKSFKKRITNDFTTRGNMRKQHWKNIVSGRDVKEKKEEKKEEKPEAVDKETKETNKEKSEKPEPVSKETNGEKAEPDATNGVDGKGKEKAIENGAQPVSTPAVAAG